jgi:hypothetical protein
MTLAGSINGTASGAARGSAIDISSTTAIWIGPSAGQGNAPSGDIVLTDSVLSGWNVASLLVGGTRGTPASDGSTPITVTTTSVTVDDGSTLNGNDLIFAAAEGIFIGQGVSLKASGSQVIPDKQVAISGDGVALRISSDGSVGIARSAVSSLASQTGMTDANGNTFTPTLAIGSSVDPDGTSPVPLGSITTLTGAGMVADSSNLSSIGQNVNFSPASSHGSLSVTLNAGSIALLMGEGESSANLDVSDASSLTLKGATLQNATSLSLGSYSAISFYGAGGLQSPGLKNLALHAAELRGFDLSGGAIALSSSGDLLIDNVMAGTSPGAVSASPNGGSLPDGSLQLGGSRILLGTGSVAIDQFASVVLNASSGIYAKESGALGVGSQSMPSDLVLDSPLLSTLGMAPSFAIISSGSCHLQNSSANSANASSAGNGGKLLLTAGNGMTLDSSILLPSGSVVVETLFGDLAIGGSSLAKISVAGATKDFNGKLQTADAGSISLISDGGNVVLGSGSSIDLSAQGASSGGSLTVIAPVGSLKMTTDPDSGQFVLKANASGGSNGGAGGAFSLDAMVINNSDLVDSGSPSLLSSIVPQLTAAGFTDSLAFRIRSGDVAVDTIVKAHSVCISADDPNQSFGTIEVTGTGSIDASGTTGGNIVLQASGSVILDPGSSLAVHGLNYDAAGKGGAIFLSAGAEINGQINPNAVLDLQSGSALDLGVTVPGRVIGTEKLPVPV